MVPAPELALRLYLQCAEVRVPCPLVLLSACSAVTLGVHCIALT